MLKGSHRIRVRVPTCVIHSMGNEGTKYDGIIILSCVVMTNPFSFI